MTWEKLFQITEKLDEWVSANLGAGTCFICMVILFIACVMSVFIMKEEAVKIEKVDEHTEMWTYKDRKVLVELGEEEEAE